MPLNESQQQELAKLLDSPVFAAAKEVVLNMTDGSVDGLPLDEAAIKMANEKGVRNAFRLLRQITLPPRDPSSNTVPRKSLTRTTRP